MAAKELEYSVASLRFKLQTRTEFMRIHVQMCPSGIITLLRKFHSQASLKQYGVVSVHLQVDLHFVPLFMDWILKTQTMQLDAVLTRVFFEEIKLKEGRMNKPFYSVQPQKSSNSILTKDSITKVSRNHN